MANTVLVVDADDSNTGLSRMLGFDRPPTPLMSLVGGKGSIKKKMGQGGLLLQDTIELSDIPREYINISDGLMLVSIGKILQALEGCACPMGVLNREFLKKLRLNSHELAIVDMEAGIEHFGRGIDEFIDLVLIVVEPSLDSLVLAEKISELAAGIKKKAWVVLNKMPSDTIARKIEADLESKGLSVIGRLVNDPLVFEAGLLGRITDQGRAYDTVGKVLDQVMQMDR
jgi:CO dehydrogenase maturation factor